MKSLFAHAVTDDGLRWYQREAVAAIESQLEHHRSTLAVLATGCGKTRIFSAVAHRHRGRVLVLAHRTELVEQGRDHLERVTGEVVEVEQAELRAGHGRIVMASVQTLQRKRLTRYPRDAFSLIIVDEAHHATARSYRTIFDHFERARILGVTATPDRGDKTALGKVFSTCAYQFTIRSAIDAGYLVPLAGMAVAVDSIDLSGISSTAGDLAAGELDAEMTKATESIVQGILTHVPEGEQGLVFSPGVKTAHSIADRLNELRPGSCVSVDGSTPEDERAKMVADFKAGKVRFFSNCLVATEGFDAPAASHVILARPTKSRALYTQMVGRITRVLPGVVDHIEGEHAADERRAAIAVSAKPRGVIIDFVGNAGKHSLVSPVDVLGDELEPEVKQAVKRKIEREQMDLEQAIALSRQELAALREMQRAALEARAQFTATSFDPFTLFHMDKKQSVSSSASWRAPSRSMADALGKWGIEAKDIERMSYEQAHKMLSTLIVRREKGLASYKQIRVLARNGIDAPNLGFKAASRLIDHFASRGWDRGAYDRSLISEITGRKS